MIKITETLETSRRDFLKKLGWIAGGVTVLSSCSSILPVLPSMNEPEMEDAFSWLQMLPDGRVLFYSPRMEMGQGASLGLSQIVAEELNVAQSDIKCVTPNTDQTPPFKMTVGSEGLAKCFIPVAFGASTLRKKLQDIAAKKYKLAVEDVIANQGGFNLPNDVFVSYRELVSDQNLILHADDNDLDGDQILDGLLNSKSAYRVIGQEWKDPSLKAIVTGEMIYSRDVDLPQMLYGKVIQKPAFGAKITAVDLGNAVLLHGIVKVVLDADRDFVGVVADNPFALSKAVEVIDVKWQVEPNMNQSYIDDQLDVESYRADNSFEHELLSSGNILKKKGASKFLQEARYDTSFAAHGAIEPRAAIAHVTKDKVEIWCGSQDPFFVKKQVAKAVERGVEDVVVNPHRLGGGFGGRVRCQASEEAAILSAEVGRPVKVQWDRETEFQNNYFQPAFSHYIDAGVSEDGFINYWDHDFVSSPILTGAVPKNISWMLDMVMADKGTARGGLAPYNFRSSRVRYSDIRTAVPIGAWRGLGAAPNAFAIESMMDELSVKASIDPLDFRLKNLPKSSDKLRSVLKTVAEMANWGKSKMDNAGRGLACAVYKGETAVAIIAEVQIDHAEKEIHVTHVWCAQDSGLVINPDQVKSQISGNITWGCGFALKEKMTFNEGVVDFNNFGGYEILRLAEAPKISISLVAHEDKLPTAVGEAAFAPVAPAIANAVYAATKKRIRALPIDYDLVFPNTDA